MPYVAVSRAECLGFQPDFHGCQLLDSDTAVAFLHKFRFGKDGSLLIFVSEEASFRPCTTAALMLYKNT